MANIVAFSLSTCGRAGILDKTSKELLGLLPHKLKNKENIHKALMEKSDGDFLHYILGFDKIIQNSKKPLPVKRTSTILNSVERFFSQKPQSIPLKHGFRAKV